MSLYLVYLFFPPNIFYRFTTGLAAALTLWPTLQEQYHLKHKVHPISTLECPTAKTGLIGGGAFVSLDSSLLWLVALMLALNVREDYFDDSEFKPNKAQPTSTIDLDMYWVEWLIVYKASLLFSSLGISISKSPHCQFDHQDKWHDVILNVVLFLIFGFRIMFYGLWFGFD